MLIILSPAKSLDESNNEMELSSSDTRLDKKSNQLAGRLRQHSLQSLQDLMSISKDLAVLNRDRYQELTFPVPSESKQALTLFAGDVYRGIDADTMKKEDFDYAQDHIRILSGLYGWLRPLDKIQPYRLEMGTRLPIRNNKNLYQFWGDEITKLLNKDIEVLDDKTIVNLASKEYFKALNTKKIKSDIIEIHFREMRKGKPTFISFTAKVARGMMARYAIDHSVTQAEELKNFDYDGYAYDDEMSDEINWYFIK